MTETEEDPRIPVRGYGSLDLSSESGGGVANVDCNHQLERNLTKSEGPRLLVDRSSHVQLDKIGNLVEELRSSQTEFERGIYDCVNDLVDRMNHLELCVRDNHLQSMERSEKAVLSTRYILTELVRRLLNCLRIPKYRKSPQLPSVRPDNSTQSRTRMSNAKQQRLL
jgi:hypothetical protein